MDYEKIVNKTPHDLRVRIVEENLVVPLESDVVVSPTLPSVRMSSKSILIGNVNGIPVKKTVFGELENLPDPVPGVVYVVSTPAAQKAAAMGRTDVIAPNTAPGQDIRYPEGHPNAGRTFAVRTFQQF